MTTNSNLYSLAHLPFRLKLVSNSFVRIDFYDMRVPEKTIVLAEETSSIDPYEAPFYFSECDRFVSPIFLAQFVRYNLAQRFKNYDFDCAVHICYRIVNQDEVYTPWNELCMLVVDDYPKPETFRRTEYQQLRELYDAARDILSHLMEDIRTDEFYMHKTSPHYEIPTYYRRLQEFGKSETAVDDDYMDRLDELIETEHSDSSDEKTIDSIMNQLRDLQDIDSIEGMDELNRMVGLDHVKNLIHQLICDHQLNQMRNLMGLKPTSNGALHFVFSGNPGTGKTTAAKALGKALHAAGILSKGDVVCRDRSSLIGRHVGDSENNVRELFEGEGQGNLILIDEAYALAQDKWEGDFGHHIVNSLLTYTAEPNPDYVVVLCGYHDEMNHLLDSNPGMRSRFSIQLDFQDFSREQLMEISRRTLRDMEYEMTTEASLLFADIIRHVVNAKQSHFGNARWVNTAIKQHIIIAQHKRVTRLLMSGQEQPSRALLTTILPCDIMEVKSLLLQAAKPKAMAFSHQPIGFAA